MDAIFLYYHKLTDNNLVLKYKYTSLKRPYRICIDEFGKLKKVHISCPSAANSSSIWLGLASVEQP